MSADVHHPQTNSKLEMLHGEIQRKMRHFEESSVDRTTRSTGSDDIHVSGPFGTEPKKDAVARLIEWYNYEKAHQSLDWENPETPAWAHVRKMPLRGETVVDAQTREEYRAK